MELRQRPSPRSFSWKQVCDWLVVIFLGVILTSARVAGDQNCPETTGTLYAEIGGGVHRFAYSFDPIIKTNIGLIDRLLTSDEEVVCDWLVRTKPEHSAAVDIEDFYLTPPSGSKDADCLKIYDGKTADDTLLGKLCGGDIPRMSSKSYRASGRYMFIVYTQGEITGHRSFKIYYKAEPVPKTLLLKIAAIVSGSIAAVALIFLTFKFTRQCRPCRKRCCPSQPVEEVTTQRELHPLTPAALSAAGPRQGAGVPQSGNGASARAGQRNPPGGGEEEGEEDLSIPVDEPPPSYDSIFGSSAEDRNKAV